jgi:hypothetical protein
LFFSNQQRANVHETIDVIQRNGNMWVSLYDVLRRKWKKNKKSQ